MVLEREFPTPPRLAGFDSTSFSPQVIGVPTFVNVGASEFLEIGITRWVEEMQAVKGNLLGGNYEEDAPHDTILVGGNIGWADSAANVARKAGLFVRQKRERST